MNNIADRRKKLEDYLQKRQINGAISYLRKEIEVHGMHPLLSKINIIGDNYRYLYQYFISGTNDTSRKQMLDNMSEQLRVICDTINHNLRSEEPGAYFTARRLWKIHSPKLPDLLDMYKPVMSQVSLAEIVGPVPVELSKERYDILDKFFTAALVSFHNNADTSLLADVITNCDNDKSIRALSLHALVLSQLVCFDAVKLQTMLDIILDDNTDRFLKSIALPGLVFILASYSDRVRNIPSIMTRLATFADDHDNARLIRITVRAIAGTRDTERVSAKMKDEVMPELMKMRPDLLNKLKDFKMDVDPEAAENNPEWQEFLDKSGIGRKLEELAEMQSDGADLMMITFSHQKSHSFFRNIGNWFLPFDINNPELKLQESDAETLKMMTDASPTICNSDKYSLALAVASTPETHRRVMMSQFNAQFEQIMQHLNDKLAHFSEPDFERDITTTVREYYRYFKQGRNNSDFINPFDNQLTFTNLPPIKSCLEDDTYMNVMSEFYLKRGFYKDALALFTAMERKDNANPLLWQKIGFCRQKTNDYAGARDAYMKAELLDEPGIWLLKKLAYVNKRLGNPEDALEYYIRALSKDSENVKLILSAGDAALACNDVNKALSHYYHAEYINPDNKDIMRSIAWAEMLTGNLEKAEKKYSLLTAKEANAEDWLNAGHVAMLARQFSTALERYRQASLSGKSDFEMAFTADMPLLSKLGADVADMQLILDGVLFR